MKKSRFRTGSSRGAVSCCFRNWLIAAALLATCLILPPGLARAEDALDRPISLSIPANMSLEDALIEWGVKSGMAVMMNTAVTQNKITAGIHGTFPAGRALTLLLKGSGLSYAENGSRIQIVTTGSMVPMMDRGGPLREESSDDRGVPGTETSSSDTSKPDNRPDKIQEVVVTAEKREERLVDTPQSVSVLSSGDIEQLAAVRFTDFATTVPGLSFTTVGAGNNQLTLRGVSTGTNNNPTVGIYVDDVPYGSSTSFAFGGRLALDVGLFDVDRIEVLRGPQGTLYGASTMGGLIKYVSKQPDETSFQGDVRAGVSDTFGGGGVNYNVSASVNVPLISDTLAMRATAFESHDAGYYDNIALNQPRVDRSDTYGGRLDVLLTPVDRLTVQLSGFVQDIFRGGQATADYTLGGAPQYGDLSQYRPSAEPFDQRFWLTSAKLNYDMGPTSLTSISSYQSVRTALNTDVSGTFVPFFAEAGFGTYGAVGIPDLFITDKFTQEVRLASSGAHRVDWLVGAFYTREVSRYYESFSTEDTALQPVPNDLYTLTSPTFYEEYAGFGDVTVHVTTKFDLTGGLRYSRNSQVFTQAGTGAFGVNIPPVNSGQNIVTYLADAKYHLGANSTAYFRYATGYRPGGPNYTITDPTTGKPDAPTTFQPDTLKSYEVGYKAQTDDHRFDVDVAVYDINWTNIQVLTTVDNFGVVENASGGATVRGAELGLTSRPVKGLMLGGAFAYQDAHMRQESALLGAASGERLPDVPRFTAALNGDYEFSGGLRPAVGATARYMTLRTTSFNGSQLVPQYDLPAFASFDLRGSIWLKSISAQLYLHNLLNKRGQVSSYWSGANEQVALIQPRTLGLTVTGHF